MTVILKCNRIKEGGSMQFVDGFGALEIKEFFRPSDEIVPTRFSGRHGSGAVFFVCAAVFYYFTILFPRRAYYGTFQVERRIQR